MGLCTCYFVSNNRTTSYTLTSAELAQYMGMFFKEHRNGRVYSQYTSSNFGAGKVEEVRLRKGAHFGVYRKQYLADWPKPIKVLRLIGL